MDKFYFQYRNLRAGSPFPAEKFEREEVAVNMLVSRYCFKASVIFHDKIR